MYSICSEIKSGINIKRIFASVCAGGGKSELPSIIADVLLRNNIFDKICWIAPRSGLVDQGEDSFINSFIDHGCTIRAAKNSGNLSKDRDGYITTMQSVIANPEVHEAEISSCRYILFLDEFHFLSLDNIFKKEIDKLIQLSDLVVFASGTIERGAGDKVAYVPYLKDGKMDTRNTSDTKWIKYTREDALKERTITPLKFHLIEGSGRYIDKEGSERRFSKLGDSSDNLHCALQTEFADHLISYSKDLYLQQLKRYKEAKLIVIASSIEMAEKYQIYLSKNINKKVAIATSKDSGSARSNINRFKYGDIDILIGIGMFYLGFSCKQIAVVCSLTNIRSIPWLTQMAARANRQWLGKDFGHIVAPADNRFKKFIKILESEQNIYAFNEETEPAKEPSEDGSFGEQQGIEALFSEAHIITEERERQIPDSEMERSFRKNITTIINKYVYSKSVKIINGETKIIKTESINHRKMIWLKIRMLINVGRDENGILIKKPVEEMTLKELIIVSKWVERNYSIGEKI